MQDTGAALIQQGNQLEKETYLNYCFVAMLVDANPPAETAQRILDKREKPLHTARASFMPTSEVPVNPALMNNCWLPSNSLISNGDLFKTFAANARQGNCFGYCGLGCRLIPNRNGAPIYGGPCITHDRCTRSNGGNPFARPCLGSFVRAAVYVYLLW